MPIPWLRRQCEHDWNRRGNLLGRAPGRDDDIDLEPDEISRELGVAFAASLRPVILNRDGTTLDPAEAAQPLQKSSNPLAHG
jgi:hypothetical protein